MEAREHDGPTGTVSVPPMARSCATSGSAGCLASTTEKPDELVDHPSSGTAPVTQRGFPNWSKKNDLDRRLSRYTAATREIRRHLCTFQLRCDRPRRVSSVGTDLAGTSR